MIAPDLHKRQPSSEGHHGRQSSPRSTSVSAEVEQRIWARTPRPNGTRLNVLLYLAKHANDAGIVGDVRVADVARASDLSLRQVQYVLRRLEREGYLRSLIRRGRGLTTIFLVLPGGYLSDHDRPDTTKRVSEEALAYSCGENLHVSPESPEKKPALFSRFSGPLFDGLDEPEPYTYAPLPRERARATLLQVTDQYRGCAFSVRSSDTKNKTTSGSLLGGADDLAGDPPTFTKTETTFTSQQVGSYQRETDS